MHGMSQSIAQIKTAALSSRYLSVSSFLSAPGFRLPCTADREPTMKDLQKAIAAGINVIHINTELRVARRRGLEDGLAKRPHQVVPYKILPFAFESVKQVALSRLRLFNKC